MFIWLLVIYSGEKKSVHNLTDKGNCNWFQVTLRFPVNMFIWLVFISVNLLLFRQFSDSRHGFSVLSLKLAMVLYVIFLLQEMQFIRHLSDE